MTTTWISTYPDSLLCVLEDPGARELYSITATDYWSYAVNLPKSWLGIVGALETTTPVITHRLDQCWITTQIMPLLRTLGGSPLTLRRTKGLLSPNYHTRLKGKWQWAPTTNNQCMFPRPDFLSAGYKFRLIHFEHYFSACLKVQLFSEQLFVKEQQTSPDDNGQSEIDGKSFNGWPAILEPPPCFTTTSITEQCIKETGEDTPTSRGLGFGCNLRNQCWYREWTIAMETINHKSSPQIVQAV